MLENTAHKTN